MDRGNKKYEEVKIEIDNDFKSSLKVDMKELIVKEKRDFNRAKVKEETKKMIEEYERE